MAALQVSSLVLVGVFIVLLNLTLNGANVCPTGTRPQQVHISFGENEMERVITWTTLSSTGQPVVEYGEGNMNEKAKGYSKSFTDGGDEKRTIMIHRVSLKNLRPNTRYVYRCGSDDDWSEQFWFATSASHSDWSPRIAIYGDMGYTNAVSLKKLEKLTSDREIDVVVHVGDFAYDMDSENGEVGDEFMRLIEPIASHVPYMVCPGNHEYKYNFSHFRERFTMPGHSENLFYSFNVGKIHFVSVNTEAYWYLQYGLKILVKQYNWLEKDLEEANKQRKERPWIVLYGHRPMYCSGVSDECRNEAPSRVGLNGTMFGMEQLLQKYGVDIVFWGHQHSYERFFPVYNNRSLNGSTSEPYVDPKAPVHIITGSAGCDEDIEPFWFKPHPSSAFRNTNYGFTFLQFYNATHMSLKQIATDDNDQVIDEILLVKNKHGPYQTNV